MRQSSIIFLVENDKDYIYFLEQAFRGANIRNPLKVTRYGNEAILYLKGVGIYQNRRIYPLPSIILLDLSNPDGSGMAVLGWIREHSEFSQLPVIVLTEGDPANTLRGTLSRCPNAFLCKRQNLEEVIQIIKDIGAVRPDGYGQSGDHDLDLCNQAA